LVSKINLERLHVRQPWLAAALAALCLTAVPHAAAAQTPAEPPQAVADQPLQPPGPTDTPKQRRDQADRDVKAGRTAFDAGRLGEASGYFIRASQYDTTNEDAIYWLGRTLLQQGQAQQAADHFSALLGVDPRSDRAYYGRGKAYEKLGRYADAIADYNQYLEINHGQQNAIFYMSRGDAYLNNGENDLAIRDYDQALTGNAQLPQGYLRRGIAYARIMNYAQAMADFSTAYNQGRAANTLDSSNFFYRGIAEYLSGDKQAAATDFKYAQEYNDWRKDTARCLQSISGGGGFFSRMGCSGVDPTKELNKPAAY
jgi:tetratricopeptide (TPR) repeat protein